MAQKFTKTNAAAKIPKVAMAGKAEDALEIKAIKVVQEVVNMALLATLNVF